MMVITLKGSKGYGEVCLPVSDKKLEELKETMLQGDEQFYITSYDSRTIYLGEDKVEAVIQLNKLIGDALDKNSLNKLNELVEAYDNFNSEEMTVFKAFLKNGYSIEDTLNIVEKEYYIVYDNCETMADVAYQVLHDILLPSDVPGEVWRHFNYTSYGEELETSREFIAVPEEKLYIEHEI